MRPFAALILGGVCLAAAVSTSAAEPAKAIIGIALPRAQFGQGNSSTVDVAGPVRQALATYLRGPLVEVVDLEARIPQQIAAEAASRNVTYILYSDVVQKQKRSGGGLLKGLAPLAGALPMLGGMGGGMGGVGSMAATAASVAAQGAMQADMMAAQQDAMSALTGAQQSNVKAGDSITLEYQLVRTATNEPAKKAKLERKAKQNGDDVLSPLLEQVAVAVTEVVTAP